MFRMKGEGALMGKKTSIIQGSLGHTDWKVHGPAVLTSSKEDYY